MNNFDIQKRNLMNKLAGGSTLGSGKNNEQAKSGERNTTQGKIKPKECGGCKRKKKMK